MCSGRPEKPRVISGFGEQRFCVFNELRAGNPRFFRHLDGKGGEVRFGVEVSHSERSIAGGLAGGGGDEGVEEGLECGGVFAGEDEGEGAGAVFEAVEADGGFALVGNGSAGDGSVAAGGLDLRGGAVGGVFGIHCARRIARGADAGWDWRDGWVNGIRRLGGGES